MKASDASRSVQMRALPLLGALVVSSAVVAADPGPPAGINVNVVNPPSKPVPVTLQGTSTVSGNVVVTNTPSVNVVSTPGIETQLLLDQQFVNDDRVTIPVAAYKTVHVDFNLVSGTCFGSGAVLFTFEGTTFLDRGRISDTDACVGGFTGRFIEMPGRSLTFHVAAPPGSIWRVVVFGRAN